MSVEADTTPAMAAVVAQRYRAMTPLERLLAVASMNETARLIVQASLPDGLTPEEQRYAVARRFYGTALPEAALRAHASYRKRRAIG